MNKLLNHFKEPVAIFVAQKNGIGPVAFLSELNTRMAGHFGNVLIIVPDSPVHWVQEVLEFGEQAKSLAIEFDFITVNADDYNNLALGRCLELSNKIALRSFCFCRRIKGSGRPAGQDDLFEAFAANGLHPLSFPIAERSVKQ